MTPFEEFAKEIGVPITTDKDGFYTKHCAALAKILTEIMFDEIDEGKAENLARTMHKAEEEFYRQFPYMRK